MMRVLIADDDAITRTVLTESLLSWGYNPVAVENGYQAWELLQRKDAPRLMILDWILPGISGIQLCRRLQPGRINRPCYIIMLTGKITTEDVVAGFEAGADDYVIKPFKGPGLHARVNAGARILDMIDQRTKDKTGAPKQPPPYPALGDSQKVENRILIAEDDAISRMVLMENLTGWGYDVIPSENGDEAWEVLNGDNPPRIAVLDWLMPKMSGIDVVRRVRRRDDRRPPFIIMLTALGETESVAAGFEAGVDDYLVKPFSAAELRARIDVGFRLTAIQDKLADRAGRAEADYFAIFENALEGIYQITSEGRFITVNSSLVRIYGYASGADLFERVESIADQLYVDPKRYQEFRQFIKEGGQLSHFESEIKRGDGGTAWIAENVRSVFDRKGEFIHYEGFVQDITKRKQAEALLQTRAIELEALYQVGKKVGENLSIDGVIKAAIEGIANAISPDFSLFYIVDGDRLIPQLIHADIPDPHKDEGHFHVVGECLCGLAALETQSVYSKDIHNDKRCTWSECKNAGVRSFAAFPLIGKEGLLGVLGLASYNIRDFSEQSEYIETLISQIALAMENAVFYQRLLSQATNLERVVKERTRQLSEAKERAESADRLKSAFLANMSHELRTPLNSIIGFTGTILMGIAGELNEEQHKQMTMVQNSATHLLNLINDILDLSKIEAGQLEVKKTTFNFQNVLGKVIQTIKPMADKKAIDLIVDASPAMIKIFSDRRRLEQILINLINNAVKFTDKGHVKVCSRKEEGLLITSIIDTGIGISSENLDDIFNAFSQAESGLARKYEGTGLGLSICKSLVNKLGGELSVESKGLNHGSTFTFKLPTQIEE